MRQTLSPQDLGPPWIMCDRMTSRREEKDQRRAERLAAEQTAAEQAKRRRTYSIVVGGALALAAVAAIVAVAATGGGDGGHGGDPAISGTESYSGGATPPPQEATDLFAVAPEAGCVLRNPVIEGRTHISPEQDVEYKTTPPTSGNHDPQPAGDGVYSAPPTARTTKNFVHTLEHGRIIIQYDPQLSKRRIDQLGGLFNDDPYHMVLMPNRRMPYQIAVTAWGHLLGCKEANDKVFDAIRAFRDRYRDQGPEQAA
jgi:Protein of unknown function (DUF3105)